MSTIKQERDISDNTVRGKVLTSLIQAASEGAPPSMTPWTLPLQLSHPPHVSSAPAHVWNTSNNLRVMNQHIKSLCAACTSSPFLQGDTDTCVAGLEWFRPYSKETSPLTQESFEKLHALLQHCAALKGQDTHSAAFDMHRAILKPDRGLTQLMLEQHFDGQRREYEIDVCGYMLAQSNLTYSAWKEQMPRWRQEGLYYPLVLGAICMPTVSHWLPADQCESPFAHELRQCLADLRDPNAAHESSLANLAAAWQHDQTGAALIVGGTLDRLAVLMGIKSNGRPELCDFDLSRCMTSFHSTISPLDSEDLHAHNYRCWHQLKRAVESTFPPSTLCTPLVSPKRESWGYSHLTLQVQGRTAYFLENTLEPTPALRTNESYAHAFTPAASKRFACQQTSQRLQDTLWKLGEIACSPEVASCMTTPHMSMASIMAQTVEDSRDDQGTHAGLAAMGSPVCVVRASQMEHNYQVYTHSLDAMLPASTFHIFPKLQHMLMWRLDTPPRAIIYTGSGDDVDPQCGSQQHLPKLLINAKTKTRQIGSIHHCEEAASEETVRNCLKTFAAQELWTHPENTVLYTKINAEQHEGPPGQVMPLTCTTLAESVATFALHVPEAISVRPLGESCTWKEDGIDPRYAEMQLAENGFRLRDWTAMHIGKGGTQQSRLAAHTVNFIGMHTLAMPWIDHNNSTTWVSVGSSLPLDNQSLHGPTLKKAVENRYIHDLKMLPNIEDGTISKQNCEIYTDARGSVAIAYAIDRCPNIHFITFQVFQETP